MLNRHSLFVLFVSALLMLGCGDQPTDANNDNGDDPEPPGDNLPTDVSFAEDVQPIFESSCGGANCHISQERSGVRLASYDDVVNSVGDQYEESIVDAGNPGDSPLVDKITPSPAIGSRMPETGNYLSDDEIDLIRGWIDEGAEDN